LDYTRSGLVWEGNSEWISLTPSFKPVYRAKDRDKAFQRLA